MSLAIVQWQDGVDILLISILVHRLFLLFRGTAVVQVLASLALLAAMQWVALAAGLALTHRFIQATIPLVVLVLVVSFRNEIREAVLQINPARLVMGRPAPLLNLDLGALVAVVSRLCASRTGALIVLRSRNKLSAHLHEGIVLGGRFSPQILESIFAKDSPVHDGAVIIRGNRIERIGTFLPLSVKPDLPSQYGTRHRAAVGLSERTDSVVLVVSEERGEISVVHRGAITLVDRIEDLEPLLRRLWHGNLAAADLRLRWSEAIRQLGSFVAVLGLVSLCWWFLVREQSQVTLTPAIAARNVPADLVLRGLYRQNGQGMFGAAIERVEVQVSGREILVKQLVPDEVLVFVDLGGMAAGRHPISLGVANVEIPPGLNVIQVSPSRIVVDLEPRITRRLPVDPQFVGVPPQGFDAVAVADPPELMITGPQSQLAERDRVPTTAIDLAGMSPRDSPKTFPVGLNLSPASLRPANGQPEQVRVTVTLKPRAAPTPVGPPRLDGDTSSGPERPREK